MMQSCGVDHCTSILRLRPHGGLDLVSAIISNREMIKLSSGVRPSVRPSVCKEFLCKCVC